MVQIENREAVENVHAIAAVDGIGQYFIFESAYTLIDRLTELLNGD